MTVDQLAVEFARGVPYPDLLNRAHWFFGALERLGALRSSTITPQALLLELEARPQHQVAPASVVK